MTDLISAFKSAMSAGVAAANVDDDGTCNFDSVIVRSRRSAKLEAAAKEAGFNPTYRRANRLHYGGYEIDAPRGGQGARRTLQCKAIAEALRGHGLDAQVEYVTD